jgi:tetratricopeptide (TPR) repeat protein
MLGFSRAVAGLASVIFCLVLCPPGRALAAPSAADLELAKAHFRTGELNYERASYADAAKEFEEAYRLSGRAEMLYNMGKSYDGSGDMRGALAAYRRFLSAVTTSPDRPFVEKRAAELDVLVARLTITCPVPGATVTLDGQKIGVVPLPPPPLELNPGDHALEVAAEGYGTFRRKIHLEQRQTETVDAPLVSLVKVIRVEEKKVPVYKRWYLWTAVGVVVAAGVVTGAVLGARKANEIDGPSLQLPKVQ